MRPWRFRVYEVIFGTETRAGRAFDVCLLWTILISVLSVMLESVASVRAQFGNLFRAVELTVTVLFTVEYILRLVCVPRPLKYARSFFGLVDLLSLLPLYIGFVLTGGSSLVVIRVLRLLRIFRVLKLARFMKQADALLAVLKQSRYKIGVFLGAIATLILILGTVMYLIEGPQHGFSSIPQSMYWAVVTMTTVGYGDIAPATVAGKLLASVIMLIGYSVIVIPTGIVTFEAVGMAGRRVQGPRCPDCGLTRHEADAVYCRRCGACLGERRA